MYGQFQGRVCSFSTLTAIWSGIDALPIEARLYHANICRFLPDVSEHITDSTEYRTWETIEIPDESGRHNKFAQYLERKFAMNNLIVLFLGDLARYQQ